MPMSVRLPRRCPVVVVSGHRWFADILVRFRDGMCGAQWHSRWNYKLKSSTAIAPVQWCSVCGWCCISSTQCATDRTGVWKFLILPSCRPQTPEPLDWCWSWVINIWNIISNSTGLSIRNESPQWKVFINHVTNCQDFYGMQYKMH